MTPPRKQWTMAPVQYEMLEAKLNAAGLGISISGLAGTVTKDAATVSWRYDGNVLSVTVEHALPFEGGFVMGKIASAIDHALTAA